MSPEEIQNQTAEQFHNSDSKLSPKKGRGAGAHVEGIARERVQLVKRHKLDGAATQYT